VTTPTAPNNLLKEVSVGPGVYIERPVIGEKLQWRLFIASLVLSDAMMVGLALLLAYVIRFEWDLPVFRLEVKPTYEYYRSISFVLIALSVINYGVHGLYKGQNLLGGTQEYAKVFRSTSTTTLLIIIAGFLEQSLVLARGWLFLSWVLTFLLVSLGRLVLRRLIYRLRRRGYFLKPAVVIGFNDEARSMVQQLVSWKTSGLHLVGFLDNSAEPNTVVYQNLRILGGVEKLENLIKTYGVTELILITSALTRRDIVELFQSYGFRDNINLRLSSGLFELVTTGLEVKEIGTVPLVCINQLRMNGMDRFLKVTLDYAITIPALILLAPFFALMVLLIRLDSPGPAFYRRRVLGIHGQHIDAFKFRTMHINGDEILARYPELQNELARDFKLKDDPRVTRVGRILRQTSLDELPQLFNVLLHQMSLVGPRMIAPEESKEYEHWSMNLLTVYPGISGLWQVSGRSDLSYEERVTLDMHYIRNWTIWLDLQILIQTFPAVLRRRGAY
jgi:exopolysaccharide biosynthesis polyprenyl glycosylphosphotransferase